MSAHASSAASTTTPYKLAIGAIGVVFGDIGTSPLYAFREALHAVTEPGQMVARESVLGILSLILWSMFLIVTCKYVLLLMRIDNKGEGGTLALMALARRVFYRNTIAFLYLGIFGAALFFADSMITPAISVLSAVEGLKTVTPAFDNFIIPITIGILLGLFSFQSRGTATVSRIFGPAMLVWFSTLAILGLMHINDDLQIFYAFSPFYGLKFLAENGMVSMLTLGAVFLAVTGAEALYADLGHFGRTPIQGAWLWFVFPALTLNYLGQGAMILAHPELAGNPFFSLAPEEFKLPLVLLSTCATVIASQAVITGAFSIARQAVNLGLMPRMRIAHTSAETSGQIYMPQINYMLMIGAILLVLTFQSSSALAATYGISVSGALLVDAIMAFFVLWQLMDWKWWKTALIMGPFILIDLSFVGTNMLKFFTGGWVPVAFAFIVVTLMVTWVRGSFIIERRSSKRDPRLQKFLADYSTRWPDVKRVAGSALFMASNPETVPPSLIQNLNHNHVMHERNIILSVQISSEPFVTAEQQAEIHVLNDDFTQVILRFGFKDDINVRQALITLSQSGNNDTLFDWRHMSIFVSRRSLRPSDRYGLPLWLDSIYVLMHRNANDPTDYYRLPVGRVIEIGRQVYI